MLSELLRGSDQRSSLWSLPTGLARHGGGVNEPRIDALLRAAPTTAAQTWCSATTLSVPRSAIVRSSGCQAMTNGLCGSGASESKHSTSAARHGRAASGFHAVAVGKRVDLAALCADDRGEGRV